jgi:carbon-monoxide dehydrogenase large subunit
MPTTPDFRRADGRRTATALRRGLAHEFARYVGEAVAAVVAESREQARDAVEAIVLDLEELPAVTDARAARADGARSSSPSRRTTSLPRCATAMPPRPRPPFARAAHRIALDVHNQRLAPSPMEPRSVVASFDEPSGRIEVRISNQMPTGVAGGIAGSLPDLTQPQVHVLVGDVGGGFGMKTGAYPEDLVVAHAARALKRPVRWQGRAQRGVPLGVPRPRRRQPRRARARRRRAGAGAAREVARQRRRLRHAGRRRRSSC